MTLLNWLDSPLAERGIYVAGPDDCDWCYTSYEELAIKVGSAATVLIEYGVARGDVVSILLSSPMDFAVGFYGAIVAGAVPSPIATPLTFRSLDSYIRHVSTLLTAAAPAVVLTDNTNSGFVRKASVSMASAPVICELDLYAAQFPSPLKRRDPAEHLLLQFTSGSSGTPKAVQVSGANLDGNVSAILSVSDWRPDDVGATWLPLYHDFGLIAALLTPIAAGADLRILTPDQFIRSPLRWLNCLGRLGATITTAPSFGYSYTARRVTPDEIADLDFAGWRLAGLGAERVDPVGIAKFVKLTSPRGFSTRNFTVGYGLAEATLGVTGTQAGSGARLVELATDGLREGLPVSITREEPLGAEVADGNWLASCGRPLEGAIVDIVDVESGEPLPDGYVGEIRVQGRYVADGYRLAESDSVSSFRDDGLHTGDSGIILGGELYVLGRIGDSIKIRGAKLYAEDVDAHVTRATGLNPGRHAAVLGTADGVDVVAVFVEDDGDSWVEALKSTVRALVSENTALSVFRVGRGEVERTTSGKPRRRVLWRRLVNGEGPGELVYTNWSVNSAASVTWHQHQMAVSQT